ncbi:MAG: ATP-binding protein [Woeseiaceae bacterium]
MARNLCNLRVVAIASVLLVLPGANLLSQTADTTQILILNSYDGSSAPYYPLKEAFSTELERQFKGRISFYEANLDAGVDDFDVRKSLVAGLLQNRYSEVPPDIVVAVGPPAVRFWLDYRDLISGSTPFIAFSRGGLFSPEDLRPGDIGRFSRFSFSDSVEEILRLRPETSHIMMVYGSSPLERLSATRLRSNLDAYPEQLTFEFTSDMTMHEVEIRLGQLPKTSAIIFGIFNVDAAGVHFPADSGLAAIRSASPVPMFGALDSQLGAGIVGGRVIPLQRIGFEAASSAVAILNGTQVPEPWKSFDSSTPVYDWRELERWGIDTDRLPPGSEVRFRPLSLWDQYAAWIVLATTLVVVQGLLIVALLTQRRHRHTAELARAQLSGQLINAHEDERRSIARELHDDLSQRLARLAIDAGVIRQDQSTDTLDGELENLRDDLARVSEDVHDMSYRLHPSLVEDLGITTALRAECQRVRKYADVPIKENIGETHGRILKDAALCAYRVIQEALNNAVRHARANSIEVLFEKEGQVLKLEVSDDGCGFDKAQVKTGGSIGLSSMRERVQLLDGTFSIRSVPGSGTTVSAIVPLTELTS